MIDGLGGEFVPCEALDPLGRPRTAEYGLTRDGMAVIEMAQASGLLLIAEGERDPCETTTFGTGQLIRDALDRGARRFMIGIGGSATNDGGAGMAQALGYLLLDENGGETAPGGLALSGLSRIDASGADARISESLFTVACDVDNPLLGPNGASAVFGPQKGATPEKVRKLDKALSRFAVRVREDLGKDVANVPGAGAAGGLGAGCLAFLDAKLDKGIDIVIGATGLADKIKGADLVITGEGRTDSQTFGGKTVYGVLKLAKALGVPAIVISGSLSEGADELLKHGAIGLYSIVEAGVSTEKAMKDGTALLGLRAEKAVREFAQGNL